jgi:NAD(P)-dependent dehydrogenase (short-subunit alcohol dehydrogenase family)
LLKGEETDMSESRSIVVTGVSRGLGRALTSDFIHRGHRVAGCCRSAGAVEELQSEFAAPHHFTAVDVTDADAVETWAGKVLDHFGPPDLLINNAAVINANACLWEVPLDEFHALVDINIKGVFHVIRAFVPAMVERGEGIVVNFSSTWGRSTSPEVAPYCASKWAMEGLSKAMADELPRGMAAVAFNPGVIHTDMLESCFGSGASSFPKPSQWVRNAAPVLLGLTAADNGRSVSVS